MWSTMASLWNWSQLRSSSSCLALRAVPVAASNAVQTLASSSGSKLSNVLHMPLWRSTQRRTLRCRRSR